MSERDEFTDLELELSISLEEASRYSRRVGSILDAGERLTPTELRLIRRHTLDVSTEMQRVRSLLADAMQRASVEAQS